MNRPDPPRDAASNPLAFQRAKHDAPIGKHHWMQRARDIEVANLIKIRRVRLIHRQIRITIIHHEEL